MELTLEDALRRAQDLLDRKDLRVREDGAAL